MICGAENGTNGYQLGVFIVDICSVAFACYFVAPYHPYRSACGISYGNEKLAKMASNSVSYSFNSWCIDGL